MLDDMLDFRTLMISTIDGPNDTYVSNLTLFIVIHEFCHRIILRKYSLIKWSAQQIALCQTLNR